MTRFNLDSLQGAAITDVHVAGFVQKDEHPIRFYALYRVVFVEFDRAMLRLSVLGDSGHLQLVSVDALRFDAELDDDMLPAVTSVGQMVLRDPDGTNALLAVQLWDLRGTANALQCAALRFDLVNGQKLFVDPSFHFGIRMGGQDHEDAWKQNWTGAPVEPTEFAASSRPDPG